MRSLADQQDGLSETASVERESPKAFLQSGMKIPEDNDEGESDLARVVTFEDDDTISDGTLSTSSSSDTNTLLDNARFKFEAVAATRVGEYIASSSSSGGDDSTFEDIRQWSLDDFELIQKLGEGGVATVYEAREISSGFHVALKAQKTEDGLADMEIDIHQELRHPNIVGFFDYFFADSFFGKPSESDGNETDTLEAGRRYVYSIMELCRGGSLYDVITREPNGRMTNEALAAKWMKSAMEGIKYLHELGILHCDVKTANFVVGGSHVLKVTDFGFSVRVDEAADEEVEGGSLLYMAPEHLIAWRDGLSCSTLREEVDVYGLGAVLFEVLVGELPYVILEEVEEGESLEDAIEDLVSCWDDCDFRPHVTVLESLDEETELPIPIFPEYVSADAQDLLCRLLHHKPEERITLQDALEHPWILKFTTA